MIVSLLTYCTPSKEITERADTIFTESDYNMGLELVKQSDCFTCHKINERNIGPAFRDIANKYERISESVIEKLSNKIRNGGSGSWGTVPMAPHSRHSKSETEAMIKYILLTKYK